MSKLCATLAALVIFVGCGGSGIVFDTTDPQYLVGSWDLISVENTGNPVAFLSGYINFYGDNTFEARIQMLEEYGSVSCHGTYIGIDGHLVMNVQGSVGGSWFMNNSPDVDFYIEGGLLYFFPRLGDVGPESHEFIYQRM